MSKFNLNNNYNNFFTNKIIFFNFLKVLNLINNLIIKASFVIIIIKIIIIISIIIKYIIINL